MGHEMAIRWTWLALAAILGCAGARAGVNRSTMPIEIGEWQSLPSEGGDALALDGERVAIAGQGHLVVVEGRRGILSLDARSPSPGDPRFVGDRVYWGPGFVDLRTGRFEEWSGVVPSQVPGGSGRVQSYAWSSDGAALAASFTDAGGRARVARFRAPPAKRETSLLDEQGLAPRALWVGRRAIVVGSPRPQVFDRDGAPMAEIALDGGAIARLRVDARER